jgi:hypothetical protein
VYFGACSKIVDYFNSIEYPIPLRVNPADHLRKLYLENELLTDSFSGFSDFQLNVTYITMQHTYVSLETKRKMIKLKN